MKQIKVRAHAKVNLFLEVLGKRKDGYHEVETILQNIELADELSFSSSPEVKVVYAAGTAIPAEEDLVIKAARLLQRETGIREGVLINLHKNIPAGSGLGGGSADAAASLAALNLWWGLDLPLSFLQELAAELGADIPFFLGSSTALAHGKGEKLEAIAALPFCHLVIAKPDFDILTPEAFEKIDAVPRKPKNPSPLIDALEKGDLQEIGKCLYNAFEMVVAEWHPEVMMLKDKALQAGALGALMTGSGSAIFALAAHRESAEAIASELSYSSSTVMVTTSYPRGIDLEN